MKRALHLLVSLHLLVPMVMPAAGGASCVTVTPHGAVHVHADEAVAGVSASGHDHTRQVESTGGVPETGGSPGASCGLLMACGSAVVAVAAGAPVEREPVLEPAHAGSEVRYDSPSFPFETPPPKEFLI